MRGQSGIVLDFVPTKNVGTACPPCFVAGARTDFVVTPSAALMFHHSAKHALSNGEGSRGVTSRVQFSTTSGLELTGLLNIAGGVGTRTDEGLDRWMGAGLWVDQVLEF